MVVHRGSVARWCAQRSHIVTLYVTTRGQRTYSKNISFNCISLSQMTMPSAPVLAATVLVIVSIVYVVLTKTSFLHRLLVFILHRVLRQSSSKHTTKRLTNGTPTCCRHA